MSSLNKAMIIGNLGANPEKLGKGEVCVVNLAVATSEKWKEKNSGEVKEETQWHRVTLFGRVAEVALQYLKKGDKVYIEGKIKTDKYEDKEGITRYTTKIIGREMKMLSSKGQSGDDSKQKSGYNGPEYQKAKDGDKKPCTDFDDDIPF